ncbi:MAG: HAMP domain-containing protein [Anaeromyxobacter sp.]|nr:HAMP domain-containing protein [Anaeromyxobacter sp.]MBL0277262.1 HAMP domain-containing protein [Anaeromyxobacter sp.]
MAALVLAAVLPLVPALLAAAWLADNNAGVWLAPRVAERLAAVPGTYQELFRARKQLYGEQARGLARALPVETAALRPALERALARLPLLRHAQVLGPDGAVLAEADGPGEPDEAAGWRAAPVEVSLPDGRTLRATFAVEASLFAELDETRELAETARDMEKTRAEVRRSIVLVFGATVATAALLAAALGYLMARRTVRRLARLAEAHRRVAAGDLSVRVAPERGGDEVAALARGFNVMVGEVRQARDRIVYLEKISGWQEVARRLAHEIKNPLTPIQLAFQQLEARWRQQPGGDPAFGRLLGDAGEIVRQEVATLQRLVEEFSAFARLPDVRPEPADLGAFVAAFLETSPQLAEAADVELVRTGGLVPVALDPTMMRRVLANLTENAVQAAAPARARLHLGVARGRDRAVLTVADEGPGIEQGLRARVFDPYVTTKASGTGLGLAVVKKIVLQHGGEIEVGERPGGGAAFTLALPLAEPPEAGG